MSENPTQVFGHLVRRRKKPDTFLHFAVIDGRPECVGVEVGARVLPPRPPTDRLWRIRPGAGLEGPIRPLSPSQLRGLGLDEAIRKAQRQWAGLIKEVASDDFELPSGRPVPKQWREEARGRLPLAEAVERGPGRPPKYDAEHFREVARLYREGDALGRTPTRHVARAFGVPPSTAAHWVAEARSPKYRFLPETTRGKARAVGRTRKATTRSRGQAARKGKG